MSSRCHSLNNIDIVSSILNEKEAPSDIQSDQDDVESPVEESTPAKRKKLDPQSTFPKKSELESLLITQNMERHEKEMVLLDLKIKNEFLKNDILNQRKKENESIVYGESSFRDI